MSGRCRKTKMMMVMDEVNPHQHLLSDLEGINTARKYFNRFVVNSNMMAVISGIQNKVYMFQAKR
jgi:hypothetical protein